MPALHEATTLTSSLSGPTSRITSLPILILNAHSLCNCRCLMCDIWKRDTKEQIRAEDLERHRAAIQKLGVRHVVLTGGEPLLHNNLAALCNFFRDQKIRLTLLTTGLLLLKRAKEVAALFNDVIISIDGPQEIHDSIRRVNGAYDLIQRGVAAVRSYHPSLPITCRTTIQKANHRHLVATVDAAKKLGLYSISFLAADLTSEAFNRPLLWIGEKQSEIGLSDEETAYLEVEVERLIEKCQAEIRSKFIAESPAKLRRIPRHFREHLGQIHPEAPICNAPWVSTVVEIDGTVRPCFFHRSVGNLTTSTLEEVVNGEAAQEFRQSLDVATNATCQRCVCSLNYHQS